MELELTLQIVLISKRFLFVLVVIMLDNFIEIY